MFLLQRLQARPVQLVRTLRQVLFVQVMERDALPFSMNEGDPHSEAEDVGNMFLPVHPAVAHNDPQHVPGTDAHGAPADLPLEGAMSLSDFFTDNGDTSDWHPNRVASALLEFLREDLDLHGPVRRVKRKSRSPLADLQNLIHHRSSVLFDQANWKLKTAARDLYRSCLQKLTGLTKREVASDPRHRWAQATSECKGIWARLHHARSHNDSVAGSVNKALSLSRVRRKSQGGSDVKSDEAAAGSTGKTVSGYGFLLTYQLDAGQGDPQVDRLVQQGLSDLELCKQFSTLPCYTEVFEQGWVFACELAESLAFPIVNVSLERSENSPDHWRTHLHMAISLNPRTLNGSERPALRTRPISRLIWDGRHPHVNACCPVRFGFKSVATHMISEAYYVVGPKISTVLKRSGPGSRPFEDRWNKRLRDPESEILVSHGHITS